MSSTPATAGYELDPSALLSVLAAVQGGDFSARMPLDWTGVAGKIADGLNDVIRNNQILEQELARVSELIGEHGQLSRHALLGSTRSWSGTVQSVNDMIDALVRPTSEMQRVIGAVADGDRAEKVSADVCGEMLELKNTINAMVDQLNGFVSEVTRVTREVTEGKLGQAAAATIEVGARARDAALAAIVMQKNFTATASHELRTPTTAILGFCEEIMDNDAMTGEDRDLLEIVHRNALRLARLIDDLSIVGQDTIDATMMRIEPTNVDDLVERVTNNFAALAQQKAITLVTETETEAHGAHVMADPRRLEQVLTNLVSNATKFTPKGGEVTIVVTRNVEDVHIHVTDNGAGIDPADTDRIFDRFYRAQAAVDGSVQGSGLGLAIAKGMIEAQNGSIGVVSELGHGSTFTISLPATEVLGSDG